MSKLFKTTSIAVLIALLLCIAGASSSDSEADSADTPNDPYRTVRGMTVSCPRAGQIWGTDAMVKTMAKLKDLGVNWITIHPYAHIHSDGTVGGRYVRHMYDEPQWLKRPIAEARRLDLKIMIKPHISYWGSPFDWRGEIEFDTSEQWKRFFETYRQWVTMVARLSKDADAFVVGTELDRTVHHEQEWRTIIKAVRREFDGPVTYAANWDSYKDIEFWDALDVIGIQAYFPLIKHDGIPTTDELERGWARIMENLTAFADKHERRILFAELGYNRSKDAARRPWSYREGGKNAELVQKRCLDAALQAVKDSDDVVGAFLWKWFPGERQYSNFTKSTPAMRAVIRRHWSNTRHLDLTSDDRNQPAD